MEGESQAVPSPSLSPVSTQGFNYAEMAAAVAAHLTSNIENTIANSISLHMSSIQTALEAHSQKLQSMELKITDLEDFAADSQSAYSKLSKTVHYLQDKVDDLENRSRRNNLRFVGVPESIKSVDLQTFCSHTIPQALGLSHPCKVERAHRLGPPRDDSKPRPVIARYLDYSEKHRLLQNYRSQKGLVADGHKILLFADYSAELSKLRKAFAEPCRMLAQQQIKFSLAYPATLRISAPDGKQIQFTSPSRAKDYVHSLLPGPGGSPFKSPPRKKRTDTTP